MYAKMICIRWWVEGHKMSPDLDGKTVGRKDTSGGARGRVGDSQEIIESRFLRRGPQPNPSGVRKRDWRVAANFW